MVTVILCVLTVSVWLAGPTLIAMALERVRHRPDQWSRYRGVMKLRQRPIPPNVNTAELAAELRRQTR